MRSNTNQSGSKACRALTALKSVCALLCAVFAVFFFTKGLVAVYDVPDAGTYKFVGSFTFIRNVESDVEEDNDELKTCPVEFLTADGEYSLIKTYSPEGWEALEENAEVEGFVYTVGESGEVVTFDHEPSAADFDEAARDLNALAEERTFQIALALALLAVGVGVMAIWGKRFTTYEQIWFICIMALSAIVSIVAPEEDMNGFSGILIMALYLADIFLNILCELLISKQSKWNFIVSLFVEITEIATCLVLANRFATMAVTLFFWIPIDIASFVNWHRHPDRVRDDLTKVRKLSGWMAVAVITAIVVWTLVVGGIIADLDIATDLFGGNDVLKNVVAYLDACATAVGIANGLFIFFRFREQWIAWFICAAFESAINVLSGQWVLLVLKAGYFSNSTYGFIKWTKYIRAHKGEKVDKREFF